MTQPDVTLESFPFRVTLAVPKNRFEIAENLVKAFLAQVGLPASIRPSCNTSWGGEEKLPKEVLAGLRIGGIKKKKTFSEVEFSFGLFHPKSNALLLFSADLVPAGRKGTFSLVDWDRGERIAIDKDLAKRLKDGGGGQDLAPAPPSATASFSHDRGITGIAIPPHERFIATVGGDKKLCVWDPATGSAIARVAAGYGRVVDVSPDGRTAVAGLKKLIAYAMPDGKRGATYDAHPRGEVWGLAFSPAGRYLATTSTLSFQGADNSVTLWDVAKGTLLARWKLAGNDGRDVLFSADEESLYAQRADALYRFDVATRSIAAERAVSGVGRGLGRASDGIAVTFGSELHVVDATTLETKRSFAHPGFHSAYGPGLLAVSADGLRAATTHVSVRDGEWHWQVILVELTKGKVVRTLALPKGAEPPNVLTWASSGERLVAACGTRLVFWDTRSGALRATL